MGLFSLNNILVESESAKSLDIDQIGYTDNSIDNCSFVQEGYDAILVMNEFYCNAEKTFYNNLLGSYGDNNIINESFSDFFGKIKEIIAKFIAWLKKIFKEFIAKLAGLINSEKYIKKNIKLLNKFSSEDEFEYKGYKFTYINAYNVPEANALDAFNNGTDAYFTIVADRATGTDTSDDKWGINYFAADDEAKKRTATDKINAKLTDLNDTLSDSLDDFYEKFRGSVIGKTNEKYTASEFTEELFKLFRDGESSTSSITIDSNFVMDAKQRFEKYKDTIKSIEKTQKAMIKDYEDLEKHIDKLVKYNKSESKLTISSDLGAAYSSKQIGMLGTWDTDKNIYDQSTADKMNTWLKIQSGKVNQMCQIHTQAFSAKLDACKECFTQDKHILNKAIQQILKRSNKEGF